MQKAEYNCLKLAVERDEKRIKNIDRLIRSLYEDRVIDSMDADRYASIHPTVSLTNLAPYAIMKLHF